MAIAVCQSVKENVKSKPTCYRYNVFLNRIHTVLLNTVNPTAFVMKQPYIKKENHTH